ncbi:MAG: TetR/AcrR family transcriptional regulator C-terminal domain-containing protein [Kibdelosporangium sp.]
MTARSEQPRSRRERPAKPALTRAGIVAAAVGITRAEGLPRATMRRLATELDTGPASLYVYVRNTAELHAAVLDELLSGVDLGPVRAGGDWRERLENVLTSYTHVLFTHPGLAQSALVARPAGEHYVRLVEALLTLLAAGGVPGGQAAWGVDLLLQYATATAAEHVDEDPAVDADADWDVLAATVRKASSEAHPHIAAVSGELLSGSGRTRLSWGFRVLINGISGTPRPDPLS